MKTVESDSEFLSHEPEDLCLLTDYNSLSADVLSAENRVYGDSTGCSQNNQHAGFVPGYQDTRTGKTVISRYASGEPAPIHLLEGLPEDWVASRDEQGHVAETRSGIIAGFLRAGEFYTREAVMKKMAEEN